jgi:hypothetical protein
MLLVGRQHADDRRAGRQQRALLHRAAPWRAAAWTIFVRQHRRQFRLALQFREQAAIDRQLAAGKGPGIGHRIVDDDELEGQVRPVADLDQLLPDLVDIGRSAGSRMNLPPADCWFCRYCWLPMLDFLLLGDQLSSVFFVTGLVAQPPIASAASNERLMPNKRRMGGRDGFMSCHPSAKMGVPSAELAARIGHKSGVAARKGRGSASRGEGMMPRASRLARES